MSNAGPTVYFLIPEALPFGWSFKATAEHVIDRVPAFASVSGARKGGKLIEAIEIAETNPPHIVEWPKDLWELVKAFIASEQYQLPSNLIFRDGVLTDKIVPRKLYLAHIDAILGATDTPPAITVPVPPSFKNSVS